MSSNLQQYRSNTRNMKDVAGATEYAVTIVIRVNIIYKMVKKIY